ncbi:MAG: hypothetical protein M3N21_04795 [Actinomycetota bacterium]|nr:hypothetical protein [Actinomycetota bacterium]
MKARTVAAVLAVGWLATPHAVALYDGVGFPDQPYRYVTAPPGQGGRPAPTGAAGSSPVSFGINAAGLHLASNESGPQVVVDLPAGSLIVKGGHAVRAAVEPLGPDVQPTEGSVDSNVYRVTIQADAGAAQLSPDGSAYLYLRAAQLTDPLPHLDYRPSAGATWQSLKTDRIGTDVFSAPVQGPGDYAVVKLAKAKAGGSGATSRVLLLVGGIAILLGLAVFAIRRTGGAEGAA